MSAGSDYADAVTRIDQHLADVRESAVRRRGQLIGTTLQSLANLPQAFFQQRQAEQDRQTAQQDHAQKARALDLEIQTSERNLNAKADPRDSALKDLNLRTKRAQAAIGFLMETDAQTYAQTRPILLSIFGPGAEQEFTEQYPGDVVIKGHIAEGRDVEKMLAERAEAAKPKPTVPVKTTDASGNPVTRFVIPKEGEEYPEQAPKPPTAPNVGSFEDYVTRKYGQSPTDANILEARKAYGQADDRTAGAQAADVTTLTPAGLDMAALNYKKTGVMPALGMGDRTTRQRIINRASELTTADVTRIEAGGNDLAANRAGYGADVDSLKALTKSRDAISAFENTAAKNIDIFLETAGKVVDTGSPLANTVARVLSGKLLGSPDQAKYEAARQVAINEVAKIVSNPNLSGTLSDAARHEVEAFNPNNATLKQSVAVMRLLKRDMENRAKSLDEQIASVKGRIGGGQATPAAPTEGTEGTVNGRPAIWKTVNGQAGWYAK